MYRSCGEGDSYNSSVTVLMSVLTRKSNSFLRQDDCLNRISPLLISLAVDFKQGQQYEPCSKPIRAP